MSTDTGAFYIGQLVPASLSLTSTRILIRTPFEVIGRLFGISRVGPPGPIAGLVYDLIEGWRPYTMWKCQYRLKIPQNSGRKFPSPREVVVDSSGYPVHHDKRSVKRRRALEECNPPRNSRSQTHPDDEARGGTSYSSALGTKTTTHRMDRSADALKNSSRSLPFTATIRSGSRWNRQLRGLLIFRPWQQPGAPAIF
jgi:hypothetical protein